MDKPVLVILAAGLGSRYGGLKQMDPVDPYGHKIIDFSVYDAMQAGFQKVIFIIKRENEADFRKLVGDRMSHAIEVQFVFQELDNIPDGFKVPEDRIKPWGTAHAVYCCKEVLKGPFAVINADDYYGKEGFKVLYEYLTTTEDDDKYRYAMVNYELRNTLTENGFVARGCCTADATGNLATIVERTKIIKTEGGAAYTEDEETYVPISLDTPVSMNMWGFTLSFISELKESIKMFFEKEVPLNPLKAECFLPFEVDKLLKKDKASVKMLSTKDHWFGVTYKEDKPFVENSIKELREKGYYPEKLWD